MKRLQNISEDLKKYTREVMKDYVACFNREINSKPITINDIEYFAKIEQHRTFKGLDIQIRENQPFATKILELKKEIRTIQSREEEGSIKALEKGIMKLERQAPHQQNGKRIIGECRRRAAKVTFILF